MREMGMDMRERIARAICADGGGFCQNVGGDLGCKCGRGEAPHWSKCIATPDQLLLSGNIAAADAVLAALMEPSFGAGNDASLADKLKLAANNVEMARRVACVQHLAGWEHGIMRCAADALVNADDAKNGA